MASVTEPRKTKSRTRKSSTPQSDLQKLETSELSNVESTTSETEVLHSIPDHHFGHHHHAHHDDEEQSRLHKSLILGAVILPLLGMIAVIIMSWQFGMMSWLNLAMLIGGWYLTGLGVTVGFHRMLTHGSFEARPWVYKFWTILGSLSVEGSPIDWCMVHRKHHRFSDDHGDPHSPHLHGEGWWNSIKGFFHSHTGWMLKSNWSKKERQKYVPDLMKDPFLVSIDKYYYWWVTATLVIPMVLGGIFALFYEPTLIGVLKGAGLGFLWGGLARVCLSHHMTWSINSICHIFGSQDFKSSDDSRNNLFFGIFSHGEGWHNNHHAFPTSARHGLKWWQIDLSWMIIRGMEKLGLVWNVKLPTERQMEARAIK